jgi:glutaredoxin 3
VSPSLEPVAILRRFAEESWLAKIVVYTTSWCPYCRMAKALLTRKGQKWEEIDIEAPPGRRDEMEKRSGRTSVPQIWIGERHVGGYDDLAALDASGDLDALLA